MATINQTNALPEDAELLKQIESERWRGDYQSGTTYKKYDLVWDGNAVKESKVDNNDSAPSDATKWKDILVFEHFATKKESEIYASSLGIKYMKKPTDPTGITQEYIDAGKHNDMILKQIFMSNGGHDIDIDREYTYAEAKSFYTPRDIPRKTLIIEGEVPHYEPIIFNAAITIKGATTKIDYIYGGPSFYYVGDKTDAPYIYPLFIANDLNTSSLVDTDKMKIAKSYNDIDRLAQAIISGSTTIRTRTFTPTRTLYIENVGFLAKETCDITAIIAGWGIHHHRIAYGESNGWTTPIGIITYDLWESSNVESNIHAYKQGIVDIASNNSYYMKSPTLSVSGVSDRFSDAEMLAKKKINIQFSLEHSEKMVNMITTIHSYTRYIAPVLDGNPSRFLIDKNTSVEAAGFEQKYSATKGSTVSPPSDKTVMTGIIGIIQTKESMNILDSVYLETHLNRFGFNAQYVLLDDAKFSYSGEIRVIYGNKKEYYNILWVEGVNSAYNVGNKISVYQAGTYGGSQNLITAINTTAVSFDIAVSNHFNVINKDSAKIDSELKLTIEMPKWMYPSEATISSSSDGFGYTKVRNVEEFYRMSNILKGRIPKVKVESTTIFDLTKIPQESLYINGNNKEVYLKMNSSGALKIRDLIIASSKLKDKNLNTEDAFYLGVGTLNIKLQSTEIDSQGYSVLSVTGIRGIGSGIINLNIIDPSITTYTADQLAYLWKNESDKYRFEGGALNIFTNKKKADYGISKIFAGYPPHCIGYTNEV